METFLLCEMFPPLALSVAEHFAFIDSQYHLVVDDTDFYIDLLLFHRRLRCLVAIDLKIGKFELEYAGKMQFYLAALNTLPDNLKDLLPAPDEIASRLEVLEELS